MSGPDIVVRYTCNNPQCLGQSRCTCEHLRAYFIQTPPDEDRIREGQRRILAYLGSAEFTSGFHRLLEAVEGASI